MEQVTFSTRGYRYAGAIAHALGRLFWDPSDYAALEQRLLMALKDGLADKDNRFMCVEADGSPWVVRHNPIAFCRLLQHTAGLSTLLEPTSDLVLQAIIEALSHVEMEVFAEDSNFIL
jgi:hypothetical protein